MKFRTEFPAVKSELRLDPALPVVLIGSCFSANIAQKMRECCWPVFNDIGTLYNPLSIAKVLRLLLLSDDFDTEVRHSMFESEDYMHSWLFDSHFSRKSRSELEAAIVNARCSLLETLKSAQAMTITFGTAWCYYLADRDDYVVANCHKMPQQLFSRRRITPGEISSEWTDLCRLLKSKFPDLYFIFTVSPVRHLKDGFHGNTLSKATLQLAVEDVCSKVKDSVYFPAYEIVADDLRDYRFYASDLVHPSDQAVEYIWEKFVATFVDSKGEQMLKEGNKTFRHLNHRPIKI